MDADNFFLALVDDWAWFIAAAVFAIVELIAPGVLFIWIAAAAAAVGVLTFLLDPPLLVQLAIFAVLSVAFVWASRRYLARSLVESDHPTLNQRGAGYIGQIFTVEQEIRNGRGKLRVGDSLWLAQGADAPAGTRVTVVGADGSTLIVEPAD